MVGEELRDEAGGERPQLGRVGRPDRRDLGHDQALDEVGGVAAPGEELAQRGAAAGPDQLPGLAVEADQVGEHAMKAGVDDVGGAREQPQGPARPLETARPVGDREAHVRRLGGDAEIREEALEVRVVAVVEDDEAGVDVEAACPVLQGDRVGVPSCVVAGLEEVDVVPGAEQLVGRDEAGDPGSDNGDPQWGAPARSAHRAAASRSRHGCRGPSSRAARPSRARPPSRLKSTPRIGSSTRSAPRRRRSAA